MRIFHRRKYKNTDDTDLITLYKKKADQSIFEELYLRYAHLVMGTAMKYLKNKFDAEDITMRIFETLPKKIQTNAINNFSPWIYQVTKNECLMRLRKKSGKTSSLNFDISQEEDNVIHEKMERELLYTSLEKAIERLNDEQKICIKLFYLQKLSYQEVSIQTSLELKKVKSFIQNGKRNLKLILEQEND